MVRRLFMTILTVVAIGGLTQTANAQYMYLDSNANGVHDMGDTLNANNTATTVDIYLNTNTNLNATPADCNAVPGTAMAINSYAFNLLASGGTVAYGSYINQQAAAFPNPAQLLNPGDGVTYKNGFYSFSYSPAGLYRLGTLMITGSTGSPRIGFVDLVTGTQDFTSFGTQCPGVAGDYTYKLDGTNTQALQGTADWFDTAGLGETESLNHPPVIAAPASASTAEGWPISITATASDPDNGQSVLLEPTGYPASLVLSRTSSGLRSSTVNLTGRPSLGDAGTWVIRWEASDTGVPARTAIATTTLTIERASRPPIVSAPASVQGSASLPINFDVTVDDPDGKAITLLRAAPLPFGAFFTVIHGEARGVFSWAPSPTQRGTFRVTFSGGSIGSIGESTTTISVISPEGPRRPRVSPELRNLHPYDPTPESFLSRNADGRVSVGAFVVGDISTQDLEARGVSVGTRVGRLMTVECLLDDLPRLFDAPDVEAVIAPGRCQPFLDSSQVDIRVDGLRSVAPPPFLGQSGDSVIVGIVDTGIDVTHPDFLHITGSTRLIGYWDQGYTSGAAPQPFGYGTEWTPQAINQGSITTKDTSGHGTHIAGIAAANGRGGIACKDQLIYVGVAPEADLCVVKTNFSENRIVDGVSYILRKARLLNRPAVINLSLGTHDGPHDGTSIFDHLIGDSTGPGKLIVAAAGNDGVQPLHATATPHFAGETVVLKFEVQPYTPIAGLNVLVIGGWFEYTDSVEVTVVTPNNIVVGPVYYPSYGGVATVDGTVDICVSGTCSNQVFAQSAEIRISLYDNGNHHPAVGTWEVRVRALKAPSNPIDLYMAAGNVSAGWDQGVNFEGVVASPASADSVIAVGAHTTKNCWKRSATLTVCEEHSLALGEIAEFSSHGPRRDGVVKPDLSAPGANIVSSKSEDATFFVQQPQYVVFGGRHAVLWGTSQAAPQVAGAVALLLGQPDSAWRYAGPSRIKARLQSTSRSDSFTGVTPNYTWGYGKLDVAAAVAPVYSLKILHPSRGTLIGPSPDSITVLVGGYGPTRLFSTSRSTVA